LAMEEPGGGTIDRELDTGKPSGLLLEMEDWLDRRIPRTDARSMDALMARLSERLLSVGVTSVQDLSYQNDGTRARFMTGLMERGAFKPRLTMATGWDAYQAGEDAIADGINRGPVKIMLNETGASLEPDPSELARRVARVHRAGRQVAIHAIEPRAIAAALD